MFFCMNRSGLCPNLGDLSFDKRPNSPWSVGSDAVALELEQP
jgi:hypothetical protein